MLKRVTVTQAAVPFLRHVPQEDDSERGLHEAVEYVPLRSPPRVQFLLRRFAAVMINVAGT